MTVEVVDFEKVVTVTLRELLTPAPQIPVTNLLPGQRADEVPTPVLPSAVLAVVSQAAVSGQWRLAQRGIIAVYAHHKTRPEARALALRCYAELHGASDVGRRTDYGGVTGCTDLAILREVEEGVSGLFTFVSTYNIIAQL